jgi:hypothetical protein
VRRLVSQCLVAGAIVCAASSAAAEEHGRLFGVLPNYTTVDKQPEASAGESLDVPPMSAQYSFKLANLSSFDPVVFPFVGLKTALGAGASSDSSFGGRYGKAFADNAIGNFMTMAIVPSLLKRDPRYFRQGQGGLFHRMAYAASRSVVGQTRSGDPKFSISKVGGNLAAASLSNLYYSPADRTVTATMSRWASLMMWNTVSNELKEFWPDIHAKLHKQ